AGVEERNEAETLARVPDRPVALVVGRERLHRRMELHAPEPERLDPLHLGDRGLALVGVDAAEADEGGRMALAGVGDHLVGDPGPPCHLGPPWRGGLRAGSAAGRASTASSTTWRPSRSTPPPALRATASPSRSSPATGSPSSPATAPATPCRRTVSTTAPTSGRSVSSASSGCSPPARWAACATSTPRAPSSSVIS